MVTQDSNRLTPPSARTGLCVALVVTCGCLPGSPATPPGGQISDRPRMLMSLADSEKDADGHVVAISIFGSDISDAELAQLADFEHLTRLSLQECQAITDQGMAVIGAHRRLRTVSLINVPITDAGLAHLAASTTLDQLLLGQTKVVGTGLESLAATPITSLTMHSRVATSEGLAAITKLASLRVIELHCPQAAIEALPSLAPLAQLETFISTRTPLGAEGLARFDGCSRLKRLVLNAEDLRDDGLAVLSALAELDELTLAGAQITNNGLPQLAMPNLRLLSLAGCRGVSDQGLQNLRGLAKLEKLDLTESGVTGRDLTGLQTISTLREVIMSGGQFKGNEASLSALKALLPQCNVQILRG